VIEDEFTREGLAVEAHRSFKATDVLDVLSELMLIRGVSKHLQSDNGPELIAEAIQKFLAQTGVATLYIEPGSPWQNHYNHRRPHSSLGYQPPARFAASLGNPPLRPAQR
jgi:transposase InsO family protein